MDATVEEIRRHIQEVPDFPQRGISFKDITPLIEDGPAFHAAVDGMPRPPKGWCQLVENAGCVVAGVAFLIELRFLEVRELLEPYEVVSLIPYDD